MAATGFCPSLGCTSIPSAAYTAATEWKMAGYGDITLSAAYTAATVLERIDQLAAALSAAYTAATASRG